jgi:uncharacterized protein YnzC (UPF0291/DUF896 family)
MLHEERLKRINELSKKSKNEGLSPEEKEEQQVLRAEYLEVFRENFKGQLEGIKFSDDK